jgi:hypothetical protein
VESCKYKPDNLNYEEFVLVDLLRSYIRNELDEITNFHIRVGAEEIALDDWFVYVIEIAYHIGYAHSLLKEKMGEVTYKNMKKLVKENLIKRLREVKNERKAD